MKREQDHPIAALTCQFSCIWWMHHAIPHISAIQRDEMQIYFPSVIWIFDEKQKICDQLKVHTSERFSCIQHWAVKNSQKHSEMDLGTLRVLFSHHGCSLEEQMFNEYLHDKKSEKMKHRTYVSLLSHQLSNTNRQKMVLSYNHIFSNAMETFTRITPRKIRIIFH